MSDQLVLIETALASIQVESAGVSEIAPGVFRNLDTGVTYSLHSYPWCLAVKFSGDEKHPMGELCMRRRGHGGRHRHRTVATGRWVRTRWTEAECYVPDRSPQGPRTDAVRRERSLATKQSIRRKALRRRLEKKTPLFSQALIAEEIESRPEYFGDARA